MAAIGGRGQAEASDLERREEGREKRNFIGNEKKTEGKGNSPRELKRSSVRQISSQTDYCLPYVYRCLCLHDLALK